MAVPRNGPGGSCAAPRSPLKPIPILPVIAACLYRNFRQAWRFYGGSRVASMSKNIILLSDGTGNSSAKLFRTNVWQLFQALDLTDPARQVAYYDDGVGTSSFKPFAILGGVFGFGLKRNVIDIYSFCCRNYRDGDKIYGFGFSRGAFTIRVVAGFIARIGLVNYDGNEAHLARDAEIAYRGYRKIKNFKSGGNILIGPLRALRDWVSHVVFREPMLGKLDLVQIEKFDFLGVFDTVGAYGGAGVEGTLRT